METWRAARSIKALNAVEEAPAEVAEAAQAEAAQAEAAPAEVAPAEEAPAGNLTYAIMGLDEIDAELEEMVRAGVPRKEMRRRQVELMGPRLKVLEDAHEAWLLSEAQNNGRMPRPEEDIFLPPDTLQFFSVPARFRRQ
jgi:hypothetical protein